MYKIYYKYDNTTTMFCDDTSTLDIYKLTDTHLQLAKNSAGYLDFEMSTINIAYGMLNRMRGVIQVTKNDKLYWEGRVLSEDTDFWQNKIIYCEGIMACLNDTRQPQMAYKDLPMRSYIESLLSIHNQKVDDDKKFEVGIVTVNDNASVGNRVTNYESTWECFSNLVDEYGGYLFVRYSDGKRYLDYRKECPRTSTQKIEFGVNLMDFTKSYDMSSLCTVLLPLGETIASAGSSAVGDAIDAHVATGYYLNDDFNVEYDPSIAGHYYGSSSFFSVEAGKTYYISCRNHGGRVMWVLKDAGGNLIDYYKASTDGGMTDLVESKIEIPKSDVGNNYQLAIAGFGSDIQPRVNDSIVADENFDKYVTVETVNGGSLYITNKDAVTAYGWIEKQLTWSNVTEPAELKRLAETYLRDGQFDEMTLQIKAVDLQTMGVDADRIDILDEVWVVSSVHGLNKLFPVTELSITIGDVSDNKFTLGYKTEQTLSGVVSSTNDEIFAKLNQVPSRSSILESARENATQLINNAISGIFMLEQDENGTNIGFRISNVPDWDADGAKGWRFNIGGLGYFGDGFDQPVTLALTGEDGGIVANCITTGTMYADRIKGGTLTIGGYNNDDGVILVRNSNSDTICRFDNTGAVIHGEIYADNSDGYWMRIADGSITGGKDDYQYSEINATAVLRDGDQGINYNGLLVKSDAVHIACTMFAINGAIGTTGYLNYLSGIIVEEAEKELCLVDDYDEETGELWLVSDKSKIITSVAPSETSVYFQSGIMATGLE